ncbi:MAG: ABC transporter permease subunit [Rhodospirillales bacterium]|nr:ABC transporter permease subunit [Rhodospirillales bacterium]
MGFATAPPAALAWLCVLIFAGVVTFAKTSLPWLQIYPASGVIPLADWVNAAIDALVSVVEPVTRGIALLLEWPMLGLRDLLQWTPWPIALLAVALLAFHAAGLRLALLCGVALVYIALAGFWHQAMNTMALVGIAVPLSLTIGLAAGIWAQRTKIGAGIVPPTLDMMQTMPTFAYLIPLLVLFGFGPVVGLIASAIYACPPMVRNVRLGLTRVPSEIAEAARISGSSRYQQLFWVELPAAMAQIKVGINQTIMAALSMVIIASVIGGFDDIGWEVLSTMRKARFGESLLSGAVIVILAVVMDRISAAYAGRGRAQVGTTAKSWQLSPWTWATAGLVAFCLLLKALGLDLAIDGPAWAHEFAAWINTQLDGFVASSGQLLTDLKNAAFYYYLLPIRIGFSQAILPFTWGFTFTAEMQWGYWIALVLLTGLLILRGRWRSGGALMVAGYLLFFGLTALPWAVFFAWALLLAWQLGGCRLLLFVGGALAFILVTGMWERAMLSLYLCGAAVAMSFVLGASLGVWAAASGRVSAVLRPIADTFQTIPLFVFLIPVLMFFQVGEFTALLAIIAYAFVPALRYTENGLRQVSPQLIEVAVEQGCTKSQIFWQVKLPLAMPAILVGLNQTILYGFAMLVIAALVGTTGLGQQIFLALGAADTGLGLTAGLSMALLAMIADRMLQAIARQRFEGMQ